MMLRVRLVGYPSAFDAERRLCEKGNCRAEMVQLPSDFHMPPAGALVASFAHPQLITNGMPDLYFQSAAQRFSIEVQPDKAIRLR